VLMLEHRIHHVPIVRDGEVLGVVTDTDLLRHHMQSPFHLLKGIERADDDDLAQGYGDRLAGLVESMVSAGVEAAQIGRVVATLNDTLVGRLVHRATAELGSPPCQFAWIVFGSEGRREQALLTDQDNAIVFADDTAEARHYFAALAKTVHDGLLSASFPPCAGGFMAINWCKPLAEWESLFHDWVENPRPEALIDACNFFDFRPVYGQLDLSRLDAIVHGAGRRELFLGHMARVGVLFRPPLGLFRTIREEEGGVNVKKGGLMPIVAMARIYAIESRSRVRSTLSRLAAAATTGSVSGEGAATLGDAFRFLFQMRLHHQLAQRRRGDAVSNLVPLQQLNPLEARHLKSSFQLIRQMQEALASKYTVDLLG